MLGLRTKRKISFWNTQRHNRDCSSVLQKLILTLGTPHRTRLQNCFHGDGNYDHCLHHHPPRSHPGYGRSSAHSLAWAAYSAPNPSPPVMCATNTEYLRGGTVFLCMCVNEWHWQSKNVDTYQRLSSLCMCVCVVHLWVFSVHWRQWV